MQGVLLLVGPLFFAATIYMMLGRTIRLAGGEDVSLIPARWYTRIFVTADVATLIIQGLGTYSKFWRHSYAWRDSRSLSTLLGGAKVIWLTSGILDVSEVHRNVLRIPPGILEAPRFIHLLTAS